MRPRHQRAAGHHQEHRVRHHRQGFRHGMDQAGPARQKDRKAHRHYWIRSVIYVCWQEVD